MAQVTDPEVLAFIEKTEALCSVTLDPTDFVTYRRHYDRMADAFRRPRPPEIAVHDAPLAGVPLRHYRPAGAADRPLVLYAHGGGLVVGSLDSHDDVCAELAAAAALEVVAVDYRLAPEHRLPAQLDDVAAAWAALTAGGRPGIVAGDSAGATLVAGLCLRLRALGAAQPLAQVLIYPGLGGDRSAPSYIENAEAPLLRTADIGLYGKLYLGDAPELADLPEISPLKATDFAGLPPALIVTADVDPLRDDGAAYAAALGGAGVPAVWRNEDQLVHGYLRARHMSRRAAESFAAISAYVRQAGEAAAA